MATDKVKPKYKEGDVVVLLDGTVREIKAIYRAYGTKLFFYSLLENPKAGVSGFLYVNGMIEEINLREPTDVETLKWRLTK